MKRVKLLLGIAMSLLLSFSLFGCKKDDNTDQNPPSGAGVVSPTEGDDIFADQTPWTK